MIPVQQGIFGTIKDQTKLLGQGIDLDQFSSGKTPLLWIMLIGIGIKLKTLRRIVHRVKAHRKKMIGRRLYRGLLECTLGGHELLIHARAEIREWATGVDKGQCQHLTSKLVG